MKIAIPHSKQIIGTLRDVTKYPNGYWEIKITTNLSITQNLYIALSSEEMEDLIQRKQLEEKRE